MNETDFLQALRVTLHKTHSTLEETKNLLLETQKDVKLLSHELSLARSTLTWYAKNLSGDERAQAAEEDKGLRARVWIENHLKEDPYSGSIFEPIPA